MSLFVGLLDLFEGCVCIDLRGSQAGVPEQRLYAAYIRAVVEHRGGKRVTQHVRRVFL